MNQEQKLLVLAGPYKIDPTTVGVFAVRGQGHAVVAKCATGIYNRKDTTIVNSNQAAAHAQLVVEALQVLALTGKSPMENYLDMQRAKS